MKADISPATSARLIAEIVDAVRPVERARTAAAVERVLRTVTPGYGAQDFAGECMAVSLCGELSAEPAPYNWCPELPGRLDDGSYRDCVHEIPKMTATPAMTIVGLLDLAGDPVYDQEDALRQQQQRYAPWLVSPHLFADGEAVRP